MKYIPIGRIIWYLLCVHSLACPEVATMTLPIAGINQSRTQSWQRFSKLNKIDAGKPTDTVGCGCGWKTRDP